MHFSILITLFILIFVSGCGGHNRALIVKTDPPDAEVCIKGKAKSERFANTKSCVGTTPFEAEKVTVTNPDGERHAVKFKDVAGDKEAFYLVVSKPGYVSQVVDVPLASNNSGAGESEDWEYSLMLKSEAAALAPVPFAQAPATAAPVAAPVVAAPEIVKGSIRVTSEPIGALVYINDSLKGNTPFVLEGGGGDVVRIRLELEGYKTLEKALNLEGGKNLGINFRMPSAVGASNSAPVLAAPATAPAATAPASVAPAAANRVPAAAAPAAAPAVAPAAPAHAN